MGAKWLPIRCSARPVVGWCVSDIGEPGRETRSPTRQSKQDDWQTKWLALHDLTRSTHSRPIYGATTKMKRRLMHKLLTLLLSCTLLFATLPLSSPPVVANQQVPSGLEPLSDAPQLTDIDPGKSELRPIIERFVADRGSLSRSFPVSSSPARNSRFKQFYDSWLARLGDLDFDPLSQEGKVDYLLLVNHLQHERAQIEHEEQLFAEVVQFLPFATGITALAEARRRMEKIEPGRIATILDNLHRDTSAIHRRMETDLRLTPDSVKRSVTNRAAAEIERFRNTLRSWFNYYNGYDPVFTWWAEEPYKALDSSLTAYASFMRERSAGVKRNDPSHSPAPSLASSINPGETPREGRRQSGSLPARPGESSDIIGDPIGRDALLADLAHEMIPYSPEELIAIGWKELAWCETEMKRASAEMGFGDDWHKALEAVKNRFVEPGQQPEMIRQLATEAIEYLEKNDLVTIPPLARETWRMEMMTPERQLINPFFLGGETIQVSYPTNTMSHEAKLMSMRGNNPHFSKATVHHELIPGHHLQGFMTQRYKTYRSLFNTPFWGEGNALYWELLLWDRGFPGTPENRLGFLFWRAHRSARIIFSLSFHLEKMTPQECIELLVSKVGHERDNATAEVRRSFAGNYSPLYQAGYLIGGLQFYALRQELVGRGKMTDRAFHDAILRENRMPIELLRALLTGQKLTRGYRSNWKFYAR